MTFTLNDEQRLLKDAARAFCSEQAPVSRLRNERDAKKNGRDPELWREMAQMGWAGIIVPEEYGGAGLGYVGLGASYDRLGRFDLSDRVYETLYAMTGPTAQYYNNVGYSYMLRGNLTAALTNFRKASKLAPDNAVIANNLQILSNAASKRA